MHSLSKHFIENLSSQAALAFHSSDVQESALTWYMQSEDYLYIGEKVSTGDLLIYFVHCLHNPMKM